MFFPVRKIRVGMRYSLRELCRLTSLEVFLKRIGMSIVINAVGMIGMLAHVMPWHRLDGPSLGTATLFMKRQICLWLTQLAMVFLYPST